MNLRNRMPRALWALVLLLGMVVAACQQGPVTPALLPSGMASAPVPEAEVDAYLYVNQGQPTKFVKGIADLPVDVEVASASFWFGRTQDGEFTGAVFDFMSQATAQAIFDNLPLGADQWKHVSGVRLSLIAGTTQATRAIRESIVGGRWQELSKRYPDIWDKLNRGLPDKPPSPPRAAGFFLFKDWLDWAADKTDNPDLKKAAPLVSSAGLKGGALAAYSKTPLVPPKKADLDFLKQSGVSGLVMVQSSYPGFIFSFLLNNIASRSVPLKEISLDGEKALRLDAPEMDMTVLLKSRGNLLYLAAAGEEGLAKDLLLSALSR